MADQTHKAGQFRALHVRGAPLVLFNIWDVGSAKAVAASGAQALATGSWSVASAHGWADGERLPRAFAIDNLRRILAEAGVARVSHGPGPYLVAVPASETAARAARAGGAT